jgi:serine/threonine protein kinase
MLMANRVINRSSDTRYKLIQKRGSGNYGIVWEAKELRMVKKRWRVTRTVAMKFFYQSYIRAVGTSVVFDEVKNLYTSPTHPNIVVAFDHNEQFVDRRDRVRGYIVMECLPQSLKDYLMKMIEKDEWISVQRAGDILVGCLQGLAHAHKKGLCHGDVKPGNILLSEDGAPKLCDFGVPNVLWRGSASYCAPEVLDGEMPDAQSDLFSVGVLAYLLYAQAHPFWYSDPTCLRKEEDEIKKRRQIRPLGKDVPSKVCQVVYKLLAMKKEERYKNAEEAHFDMLAARIEEIEAIRKAGHPETVIPFEMLFGGKLPIVKVNLGEQIIVFGLIDTGADVSILPRDYAQAVGITKVEAGTAVEMAGLEGIVHGFRHEDIKIKIAGKEIHCPMIIVDSHRLAEIGVPLIIGREGVLDKLGPVTFDDKSIHIP